MPSPIPTTTGAVLLALQAQLVGWTAIGLTADRIFFSTVIDPPHTTGDREILLVPENEHVDLSSIGAGRVERRVVRYMRVVIRTRCGLDEGNRDTAWLNNATLGHYALEDAVIDALDTFLAVDGNGNALTFEPIRYKGLQGPVRTNVDRASGYGYSVAAFEVPYIRTLDQTMQ